jgi:hypothetical protein
MRRRQPLIPSDHEDVVGLCDGDQASSRHDVVHTCIEPRVSEHGRRPDGQCPSIGEANDIVNRLACHGSRNRPCGESEATGGPKPA